MITGVVNFLEILFLASLVEYC